MRPLVNVSAIVILAAASPAVAQSAGAAEQTSATDQSSPVSQNTELSEIVVTAQKRVENLQRVPVAITAVTGDQLSARGVADTVELRQVAPALNIRQTGNAFQPYIRGVGTSGGFTENPAALYIDGVYVPQQIGGLRSFNDIAQVAVLKGPQGTLFGRNATAGVIQITTRKPTHDLHAEAGASIDNYEMLLTDGYITGGLSPDVAASLSVQYGTQGKGWGRNQFTGEKAGLHSMFSVRGKILFEPSATTKIVLIGEYYRNSIVGNSRIPYRGTTYTYSSIVPTKNVYDGFSDPNPKQKVRANNVSLEVGQELGQVQLTSISSMRYARADNISDIDNSPARLFAIGIPSAPDRDYTQELQLSSLGSTRLTWVLGAFYFHNSNQIHQTLDINPPYAPIHILGDNLNRETTESIAGFGQAAWEFIAATHLILGARYTYEKRHIGAEDNTTVFGSTSLTTIEDHVSVKKPSFRVALDHQFTPETLGYVSFNTGFKSGGFQVLSPSSPAFSPETVKAYEAGLKTEILDHRVRANISGFYYDYSNIQVAVVTASVQTIRNAARARLYGLEADLEARISPGLSLSGGLSLLHASFRKYDDAQIASPNPAGGAFITTGSAAANRLPQSQKLAGNAALDYDTTLFGLNTHFNASGSYQGGYYLEADNFVHQDAYVLVNTSLRFTLPGDGASVSVWGKNLLNRRVISFGSATALGTTAGYDYAPRTYGISVRYAF